MQPFASMTTNRQCELHSNLSLDVLGSVLLIVEAIVRATGDGSAVDPGIGSLLGIEVCDSLFFRDSAEDNIHLEVKVMSDEIEGPGSAQRYEPTRGIT